MTKPKCFDCAVDLTNECYRCLQVRIARENIANGNGTRADKETIADAKRYQRETERR